MLLGYARVSKADDQDTAAQVSALEAAGCIRIYEERASGGRWNRPELHRLLGRVGQGDILVVWKLDLLSRSLKDLLLILEKIDAAGAGFRSLTEAIDTSGPAGRMMMKMLGTVNGLHHASRRNLLKRNTFQIGTFGMGITTRPRPLFKWGQACGGFSSLSLWTMLNREPAHELAPEIINQNWFDNYRIHPSLRAAYTIGFIGRSG